MKNSLPSHYTPENTVVTVWEENYSVDSKQTDKKRRYYCPILAGTALGMGSLSVITDHRTKTAEVEDLEVRKLPGGHNFRYKGVGTLLMQACVANLKQDGFTRLSSESLSLDTLHMRKRVFSPKSIEFFETNYPNVALSLSVDQVIAETERRVEEYNRANGSDIPTYDPDYFGAHVDLNLVDTHGWMPAIDQDTYLSFVRAA